MADRPQGTTQEPGRTPSADRSSDTREQLRDRGTQVQERAQEMGAQARDWAQEKGSQIKEGTQEAMRQVGASASQLAEMGRDTMNQLEEGFEDRIRNKPLQSVLIACRGRDALGFTLEEIALVSGHVAMLPSSLWRERGEGPHTGHSLTLASPMRSPLLLCLLTRIIHESQTRPWASLHDVLE